LAPQLRAGLAQNDRATSKSRRHGEEGQLAFPVLKQGDFVPFAQNR